MYLCFRYQTSSNSFHKRNKKKLSPSCLFASMSLKPFLASKLTQFKCPFTDGFPSHQNLPPRSWPNGILHKSPHNPPTHHSQGMRTGLYIKYSATFSPKCIQPHKLRLCMMAPDSRRSPSLSPPQPHQGHPVVVGEKFYSPFALWAKTMT